MVASDTVVGIVGSVILIAVMAGVFVYEYKAPNAMAPPADAKAAFLQRFPKMDPNQDIDGNGVPNYKDADMDGDGDNVTTDPVIQVVIPISGSSPAVPALPPGAPPIPGSPSGVVWSSHPFLAGTGSTRITGNVSYDVQAPAPAPESPTLDFGLVDSTGTSNPGTCNFSGTTVTCTFDLGSLTAGNYTLQATETSPGPSVSFAGSLTVHYDPGTPVSRNV
ncbi:MAG: hypothetical protein ACYDBQ_12550 [Thermoplasmatota archaeon]